MSYSILKPQGKKDRVRLNFSQLLNVSVFVEFNSLLFLSFFLWTLTNNENAHKIE